MPKADPSSVLYVGVGPPSSSSSCEKVRCSLTAKDEQIIVHHDSSCEEDSAPLLATFQAAVKLVNAHGNIKDVVHHLYGANLLPLRIFETNEKPLLGWSSSGLITGSFFESDKAVEIVGLAHVVAVGLVFSLLVGVKYPALEALKRTGAFACSIIEGEKDANKSGDLISSIIPAPSLSSIVSCVLVDRPSWPVHGVVDAVGHRLGNCPPHPLSSWLGIFVSPEGSEAQGRLMSFLMDRYGQDAARHAERKQCYWGTLCDAMLYGDVSPRWPISFVASSGRYRLFGGHTDFGGLGGPTVDCATPGELIAVMQTPPSRTGGGYLRLRNADAMYPSVDIPISDLSSVADKVVADGHHTVWSPQKWSSYVCGALTYMLCPRFKASARVRLALGLPAAASRPSRPGLAGRFSAGKPSMQRRSGSPAGPQRDIVLYVSSPGELQLSAEGGVSSSSALTGCVSMGLNQCLGLNLSKQEICEVDFGEYYLGKMAGSADKTAQLNARRGGAAVVGSFPSRTLGQVVFPPDLCIFVANAPLPRLSTSEGRAWLQRTVASWPSISDADAPGVADQAYQWAVRTMRRFGSAVYVTAVESLVKVLRAACAYKDGEFYVNRADEQYASLSHIFGSEDLQNTFGRLSAKACHDVGLAAGEPAAVLQALFTHDDEPRPGTAMPLLRELCDDGAIESVLPRCKGWAQRHRRYEIIYRLLMLLPEEDTSSADTVFTPRKSMLYGVAEVERVAAYVRILRGLDHHDAAVPPNPTSARTSPNDDADPWDAILDIVRSAQDGDRAVDDYRKFQPRKEGDTDISTPWARDAQNDVSNETILHWIQHKEELIYRPGGFERSLPEIDEAATALTELTDGKAALRVAAAGLGGTVCVHAKREVHDQTRDWLEAQGWTVQDIEQGAGGQSISL